MTTKLAIGRFQYVSFPNDELIRYWDDAHTGTRIFIGKVADDLTFFHPTHGEGKASNLPAYLAAVRASEKPDWRGIGSTTEGGEYQDPAIVGLPGMLAQHVNLFSPSTPV